MSNSDAGGQQSFTDPRILIVAASALSIVGTVLLGSSEGTVAVIAGGAAWVFAGVFAKFAYDVKRGEMA